MYVYIYMYVYICIYIYVCVKSPVLLTIRLPWGHNSNYHAVRVDTCVAQGPNIQERGEKGVAIWKRLWCYHRYLSGLEERTLARWNIQETVLETHLISLSCGQGDPFRLLPVYWAHPSYTGSGASWLALPLAWKAGDLTCNCKAVGQPKACQVPVPLMRKAPDFGANCRVLIRVQTMWESSYRKPGFCTGCFLPKRNQI